MSMAQTVPLEADQLLQRTGWSSQLTMAKCGALGSRANLAAEALKACSTFPQWPTGRMISASHYELMITNCAYQSMSCCLH